MIPNELIPQLKTAKHIVIFTGAGVSAESGIPTFRDAQTGLWAQYDPEDLATPQAFQRNPRLVWDWYAWRRSLVAQAQPNAAHYAIARLAQLVPHLTVITQNIDNLHQEAGSQSVIELHGNLQRTKCFTDGLLVESWAETDDIPPLCPRCGGLLRPDVVWFGENLPQQKLRKALQAVRDCDILLSIGTSSMVYPAAALPIEALQHGATVVEINPNPTPLTRHVDFAIPAPAGQILPTLIQKLETTD